MRLVFVNYSHPETAHISAVRVPTFARVLARRGHEVVLMTLPKAGEATVPAPLADRLRTHDWREPFLLTWQLQPSPLLVRFQAGSLPAWRRKLLNAWWYLTRGGARWDWSAAGIPVVEELRKGWKAEVVWGSFGQLDVMQLARQTARLMECPWCLDIKDTWFLNSPEWVRRVLARRYGGGSAYSVNARHLLGTARTFFKAEARVIYSGVDETLYEGGAPASATFDLVVIGSLYGRERFAGFVQGVAAWLDGLSGIERERVRLVYAGCDAAAAEQELARLRGRCRVEVHPHLPLRDMMGLCRSAAVNCYMWRSVGFHHKLIELLWCRRPILTFPGEHEESREIAREAGGDLRVCPDAGQVSQALGSIWRDGGKAAEAPPDSLKAFTWEFQADRLESLLKEVAACG